MTYHSQDNDDEIVSINSTRSDYEVGTALIEAVKQAALAAGCKCLWLIATLEMHSAPGTIHNLHQIIVSDLGSHPYPK